MRAGWQVFAWVLALSAPVVSLAQVPTPPTNDDCMTCHSDPDATRANGTSVTVTLQTLAASVHKDHACVDCHADLASAELPHAESVARVECTNCHDGEMWVNSSHGRAFAAGVTNAPTCKTCHGTHEVVRLDPEVRKYDVVKECGTCHAERLATYRDTFHGQVTDLGFARIATCADCHGAHDQLPSSDPKSWVSAERRLATCQQCHPAASANFAKYQPHADKRDRASNAPLYFTFRFMETLLLGVFGFFGVHSTLWFRRSWAERMHGSHATSRVPLDSSRSADAVEPSPDAVEPSTAAVEPSPDAPVAPSQETPDDPSRR